LLSGILLVLLARPTGAALLTGAITALALLELRVVLVLETGAALLATVPLPIAIGAGLLLLLAAAAARVLLAGGAILIVHDKSPQPRLRG
jgi:hypothetical protein